MVLYLFRFYKYFVFILISLLSANNIFSEGVLLKDGTILEGKIINQDRKRIVLRTDKGDITIPKTVISRVAVSDAAVREMKQAEVLAAKQKKTQKLKEEAKSQVKQELQKAAQTAGQTATAPNSGWLMARSAVVPGWGQIGAGSAAGTALVVTGVAGASVIVLAHGDSLAARKKYERKIVENTAVVTFIPSTATITDRLAAGFILNNSASDICTPVLDKERNTQSLFGLFYIGQLTHLAWTLGLFGGAAALAGNETPKERFDFNLYTSMSPVYRQQEATAEFRFSYLF